MNELDLDELKDEIIDAAESAVYNSVEDSVSELVKDALLEAIANCDLETKDGTIIRHRQMMRLISPDQSKVLLCFGGLLVGRDYDIHIGSQRAQAMLEVVLNRLDTTRELEEHENDEWHLRVQTWISTWETIATYPTREEALTALKKVNQAVLDGCAVYQL